MSVPAAFLIASGSANGVADATFETTAMFAATKATHRLSVPLDIDISPFFFAPWDPLYHNSLAPGPLPPPTDPDTPSANRGDEHAQWTIGKYRRRTQNPME